MASFPDEVASLVRPGSGDSFIDGSATDGTVVIGAISDEIEAIETYLLGGGGGGGGGFAGVRPAPGDFFNLATAVDTVSLVQNELVAFPVFIPGTLDIDAFCINVTVAGAGTIRVGVYDDVISARLKDFATVSVSTTGVKALTPTTAVTLSGLVHVGLVLQGVATCEVSAVEGYSLPNTGPLFGQQVYIHDGAVSGALPDPFDIDSTAVGPVPAVGLRRASA